VSTCAWKRMASLKQSDGAQRGDLPQWIQHYGVTLLWLDLLSIPCYADSKAKFGGPRSQALACRLQACGGAT
jgi:hypothetical protein